jgi:hypothetical protein
MRWRDTNERNVKAAMNALPKNLPFAHRGDRVLISGIEAHDPADIKWVSAGGAIFTYIGMVRISGDGRRPLPRLRIVVETDTTDGLATREQEVRIAVRRNEGEIDTLTFIPSR